MSELDLIIDLHINSKRQGPGSRKETLLALNFIDIFDKKNLKIADIGCGSGGQTVTIAQQIDGHITAVDLLPDFLNELNKKAKVTGVDKKITTLECSMADLPFEKNSLDIIWSEGAVYSMGFEAGIKNWKKFLKPGGYLSVSEMTWITNIRPKEIEDYWNKEYAEMDTASNKIRVLENNGYSLVGYFNLEPDSWIENYYKPMESRFAFLLEKNSYSKMAKEVVKEHKKEIEMYNRFKEYFSYGFYVAKKDS